MKSLAEYSTSRGSTRERVTFEEVILQKEGLLSDRLILAGFENYHVVECSLFHRSQLRQNWPAFLTSGDWPKKVHLQGYLQVHPPVEVRP